LVLFLFAFVGVGFGGYQANGRIVGSFFVWVLVLGDFILVGGFGFFWHFGFLSDISQFCIQHFLCMGFYLEIHLS
jgi:hypothetical protein